MKYLRDTVAITGCVLIGLGLWLIWAPLAPLGLGAILLAGAVWGHLHDPE